jgi:hypothetical protein
MPSAAESLVVYSKCSYVLPDKPATSDFTCEH